MPVINHIHTYVKYKTRPGYFMCSAPDCTHFLDKERVNGKLSLCTECGSQFILSREDLKRVRPKCLNCSNTKKARSYQKAQQLTQYLGTDLFPFPIHKTHPSELDGELETEEEELKDE
jgi:hypothetical protein